MYLCYLVDYALIFCFNFHNVKFDRCNGRNKIVRGREYSLSHTNPLHSFYQGWSNLLATQLFWIFSYSYLSIRVLVGTGRACFETLRPLAYSLLAEIVHHVRQDLSLAQVWYSSIYFRFYMGFIYPDCNLL